MLISGTNKNQNCPSNYIHIPTYAHKLYKNITCFRDKLPSSGGPEYKGILLLTECSSGISKKKYLFEKWTKEIYSQLRRHCYILEYLESIDFNCNFFSLFVVFIALNSIVVLTQNGQRLRCATIAFSEPDTDVFLRTAIYRWNKTGNILW